MKVSNCCGAEAYSNGDNDTEDFGICPECKEHCEYESLEEEDNNDKNKMIVCSRYPDAYERKYASLSMVIWCPMLDCRLSGFFHTFEEAWSDAVKWIEKKEAKKVQ